MAEPALTPKDKKRRRTGVIYAVLSFCLAGGCLALVLTAGRGGTLSCQRSAHRLLRCSVDRGAPFAVDPAEPVKTNGETRGTDVRHSYASYFILLKPSPGGFSRRVGDMNRDQAEQLARRFETLARGTEPRFSLHVPWSSDSLQMSWIGVALFFGLGVWSLWHGFRPLKPFEAEPFT